MCIPEAARAGYKGNRSAPVFVGERQGALQGAHRECGALSIGSELVPICGSGGFSMALGAAPAVARWDEEENPDSIVVIVRRRPRTRVTG